MLIAFFPSGEMEIINHKTGDKCHMKFEPYSYFGGIAKKVTGTVITSDEKVSRNFNFEMSNFLIRKYK